MDWPRQALVSSATFNVGMTVQVNSLPRHLKVTLKLLRKIEILYPQSTSQTLFKVMASSSPNTLFVSTSDFSSNSKAAKKGQKGNESAVCLFDEKGNTFFLRFFYSPGGAQILFVPPAATPKATQMRVCEKVQKRIIIIFVCYQRGPKGDFLTAFYLPPFRDTHRIGVLLPHI